jgi:hypothetical protein
MLPYLLRPPILLIPLPFTSDVHKALRPSQALYCQATPIYTVYDLITVMSCQMFRMVLCSEYLHLRKYMTTVNV